MKRFSLAVALAAFCFGSAQAEEQGFFPAQPPPSDERAYVTSLFAAGLREWCVEGNTASETCDRHRERCETLGNQGGAAEWERPYACGN
jgi:hypothetical protein